MLIALTREISSAIAKCELTHLPRVPIDIDRARAEHRDYEDALSAAGCSVTRLPSGDGLPDSVFIEDAAVVFDELAIITLPGAESRRRETPRVADELSRYRTLRFIEPPATLEGGDVLVVDRRVYVGRSSRTNKGGVAEMQMMLAVVNYSITPVEVTGCLHLKSAVTAVGDRLLLINPKWVKRDTFVGCDVVDVDPAEPFAANALKVGDQVIYPATFPRTAERLQSRGVRLRIIDVSELAKAEGAVTCCSLIFESRM